MSPVENEQETPSSSAPRPTKPLPPMEVQLNGTQVDQKGRYLVVAWDLDTTGRRLLDEICQIGAFHPAAAAEAKAKKGGEKEKEEGDKEEEEEEEDASGAFSQYVMPYKNPNPGARRSFGIR